MPNGLVCVKLIELGRKIEDFDVSDDPCVGGLLDKADREWPDNASVTRNGNDVNENTELFDGDKIFIGKKTKGNLDPFEVQFIRMGAGGGITKLPAENGNTIDDVLNSLEGELKDSFIRADGTPAYEYRIGTRKVEGTYVLQRPSDDRPIRIILSQKVKGNKLVKMPKRLFLLKAA